MSKETGTKDIVKESGGGFGDKGYQGTGLVAPKKKPKGGERDSARALCDLANHVELGRQCRISFSISDKLKLRGRRKYRCD